MPGGGPLPKGTFQLTISGNTSIHDLAGLKLDGDNDGHEGGNSVGVNQAPTIDHLADRTADPGALLRFTATGADPEGTALTYSFDPGAPSGATIDPITGVFRWTPAADQASAVYRITVRVTDGGFPSLTDATEFSVAVSALATNTAPAAMDDAYAGFEDTALVVPAPGVLGNDSDADGDTLTAALVAGPQHGALSLNLDGSFTYAPAADYNGADSFVYRAGDGTTLSEPATVTLTITPVNDAPTLTPIGNRTVAEGTLLSIVVSASDVEGGPLTFRADNLPAGSSFDPATRTFSWTPTEAQGPGTYAGIVFTV